MAPSLNSFSGGLLIKGKGKGKSSTESPTDSSYGRKLIENENERIFHCLTLSFFHSFILTQGLLFALSQSQISETNK